MKKILITGASGFIGSFVVEEALRRGFETWAAVRRTSSRVYLQDSRIRFIELDFSSEERLLAQLSGHSFDYVVHLAGITKSIHQEDFFKVNHDGTVHFVHALLKLQMPLRRFIYLSTLGVFGAIREQRPYTDICESDTPRPNTAYGKSKLMTEQFLESIGNAFNYVILRPTGVYGPREKDYYLMAKSIRHHLDFSVGYRHRDITFVYVRDVVEAIFLSLDRGMSGRKYFLSDGNVYRSSVFSTYIHKALGNSWWIRLRVPVVVLRLVTLMGEQYGRLTGQSVTLNSDKYHILKQCNWRCDIEAACDELGYHPEYDLERGVKETVAWYKANKWL